MSYDSDKSEIKKVHQQNYLGECEYETRDVSYKVCTRGNKSLGAGINKTLFREIKTRLGGFYEQVRNSFLNGKKDRDGNAEN